LCCLWQQTGCKVGYSKQDYVNYSFANRCWTVHIFRPLLKPTMINSLPHSPLFCGRINVTYGKSCFENPTKHNAEKTFVK